jgi:hypothetical protein
MLAGVGLIIPKTRWLTALVFSSVIAFAVVRYFFNQRDELPSLAVVLLLITSALAILARKNK